MADRPDEQRVVGVYPDEDTARKAARDAEGAGGRNVQVGAPEDEVASLLGEMREETEHAWMGPGNVGPFTKEQARSVPKWVFGLALVGAVVSLAVNFLGGGDLEIGTRLVIAALVGALAGATIGFLVGGGFFDARRKTKSNLAAERGVVVGATEIDATDEALAVHRPIREDVIDPEGPVATVTTEERQEEEDQEERQEERQSS